MSEQEELLGEVYQLVSAIHFSNPELIPDAIKWLDNLAEQKIVHTNLLPVVLGDA